MKDWPTVLFIVLASVLCAGWVWILAPSTFSEWVSVVASGLMLGGVGAFLLTGLVYGLKEGFDDDSWGQ